MALKILQLLGDDPETPRLQIFAMAAISGGAMTLLMVVINIAADRISEDRLGVQMPLIFLVAWMLHNFTQHYASDKAVSAVEASLRRLRLRVADKVRRCDLRFIEQQEGGIAAFSPLLSDAALLSQGVILIVRGAKSALLIVCAVLYLFYLSPPSAIAMLLVLVLLIPFLMSHNRSTRQELEKAGMQDARYLTQIEGLLAGFKEHISDRCTSDALLADVEALAKQSEQVRQSSNKRQIMEMIMSQNSIWLLLLVVVFIIPSLITESADTVLTVAATGMFLIGPMLSMTQAIPALARVDVAVGGVYALEEALNQAAADSDGLASEKGLQAFEQIELEQVGFRYRDQDGQTTFQSGPLDLTLKQGDLVFIVGGNGSGKSTMLKLLTGLYSPDSGRVMLDGKVVTDAKRANYRTLFATVFTDFHLFERIYTQPEVDPEDVNRHLKELGIGEKTHYSAKGFSKLALSTGQKKRIGFIVSLLKKRSILVLDELAADQDPAFRHFFYEELLPSLKAQGITLICVTHDDRYFHIADRVLIMREGQLH